MEPLRVENSVTFGDESSEENYQSASDNLPETPARTGSVVDSIMSTVKSAVESLTDVNLSLESDHILEKEGPSSDYTREDGKEVQRGSKEDHLLDSAIQPEGDVSSYSKKMAEEQRTGGSGASEDWSVVDPIPEAQSVTKRNEEPGFNQPDSASYDSSRGEKTTVEGIEVEESISGTSPSKISAEPEMQELAAEKRTSKTSDVVSARHPELQKMDDSQKSSHGASSPKSSIDRTSFSQSDKLPSLRRRSRSSRISGASSSSMEPAVAGPYFPVSQVRVSPRSDERENTETHRPDERGDGLDNGLASRGRSTEPKAAESSQGNVSLEGVESDVAAVGSSLGQSETASVEPSEQKRKPELNEQERKITDLSGYDSDTDEEDYEADRGVTRLERRSVHRGIKEEEAEGSSNKPAGEGPTSGRSPRREVYKIPDNDVEVEQGGSSNQFFSWPAELLVQAVGFQVKLIIQILSVSVWMFDFACSLVTRPIYQTMLVKDRATDIATGAVNQGFGVISQVRGGVAQTGPLVTKLSKKTVLGCLGSVYVIFMLSLLLIPAFFVDLVLVSRMVEEPVQLRETLNFDYTQARPSATVPILSSQDLEKAKTLSVDKLVSYRRIPSGHNFHVNVILTMPESEYNIRLGMFQVTAEVISARNQVLMRHSKPCMLRFRSAPIRLLKTIVYSIPLLIGFSTETQKLEITVLQAQEKVIPTASVRILLEPKAGYPQGGGLPELYEAELHLESALPWPKAIIRRWKWTFYVWNGVCMFLIEVAMILCCCRQVLLPGLGGGTSNVENVMTGEVKMSSKEETASKKTRDKRRVYFEDGMPGGAVAASGEGSSLGAEEADNLSNSSDESDVDAGWSMPPLEEAISTVEEGVRAMEETVKTLGESIVGGVSEGLSQAFTNAMATEKEK